VSSFILLYANTLFYNVRVTLGVSTGMILHAHFDFLRGRAAMKLGSKSRENARPDWQVRRRCADGNCAGIAGNGAGSGSTKKNSILCGERKGTLRTACRFQLAPTLA
jgi:hypothetical protein